MNGDGQYHNFGRYSITDRFQRFSTTNFKRMSVSMIVKPSLRQSLVEKFDNGDGDSDESLSDKSDNESVRTKKSNFTTTANQKNKAVLRAIDTLKVNDTRNGLLGWGEILLIVGLIQATVLGSLES
ncbi:hypothetical protein HK100_011533, partial [Physocladia obscura]